MQFAQSWRIFSALGFTMLGCGGSSIASTDAASDVVADVVDASLGPFSGTFDGVAVGPFQATLVLRPGSKRLVVLSTARLDCASFETSDWEASVSTDTVLVVLEFVGSELRYTVVPDGPLAAGQVVASRGLARAPVRQWARSGSLERTPVGVATFEAAIRLDFATSKTAAGIEAMGGTVSGAVCSVVW